MCIHVYTYIHVLYTRLQGQCYSIVQCVLYSAPKPATVHTVGPTRGNHHLRLSCGPRGGCHSVGTGREGRGGQSSAMVCETENHKMRINQPTNLSCDHHQHLCGGAQRRSKVKLFHIFFTVKWKAKSIVCSFHFKVEWLSIPRPFCCFGWCKLVRSYLVKVMHYCSLGDTETG